MNRCKQCNIIIRDDTEICPLCSCVLEKETEGQNKYPDIRLKGKKLLLVSHICLVVILLISAVLMGLDFGLFHGVLWCPVPIAILAYCYLVLRYGVINNAGYRSKIIVLTVLGILFIVFIDVATGFNRWSVNYVIPGGILLVDAAIVLLMIINYKNWQSYIIFQMVMILFSLCPMILWRIGIITSPILSLVTVGITLFLIIGTVIIGERRARTELQRRFHIR